MIILFAPSEGKRSGGTLSPLSNDSLVFPELFEKRMEAAKEYESIIQSGNEKALMDLFGLKDTNGFERYTIPFSSAPTMKAIERYDGVAYDYLDYGSLETGAQRYIDQNVLIFSNLFGPIRASDSIPDYKLKQGNKIGTLIPEKFYREHFSTHLDVLIGENEVLDIRAGFYDKFYIPGIKPTTMKFLKEGKAVSHWAKAYRGTVLREIAIAGATSIDEVLALNIDGLRLIEIIDTKKSKEIVYAIY